MGPLQSKTPFFAVSLFCDRYCCCFLLLLLLVSGRNGYYVGADSPLTAISHDLYRSSGTLLDEVRALVGRHPEQLTVTVVTYSRSRRDIGNSTFRVLLSFGQHGRELITSEVALRLLYALSEETKVPGVDPTYLDRVLDDLVIKVVPMENLNGRKLVESGELCERRNGRGVDLNRNWSVDWGKKEQDFDPYEENPGTAPFSEPEAQIMQKLAESFSPHVWVNVHSGMEGLFMPYDHKNSTPGGSKFWAMKSILEEVNRRHCHGRCIVGSGGGSVGYLAHGTSTDYMYDILRVPISFTFEIYGDLEAPSKDCFRMFNPVDAVTFSSVVNEWCAAFLLMFEIAPRRLGDTDGGRVSGDYGDSSGGMISESGGVAALRGGGAKVEGIELGLQELKTYFRLFMMSTVVLMFMFCTRISRNRSRQTKFGPLPL
ncbi:unnamed protein product [Spirodela intermedia]|uniref:Peptidase M14 domain-containing protein n=1 Tax=Spirodela intermedia TaxID=51605 RepID=A0A7I8IZX8_SPIIN|nr:unnamed protein product [Spirodela intermedia]CAA6663272.1 unnamed protein product [Spirodela intermedia]